MKTTKKLSCLVLAAVIVLTLLPAVSAAHPFGDVPRGAWYEAYVEYCYDNGLMGGMDARTFGPDISMDRAMLVTVISRIDPDAASFTGTVPFTDVPAQAYYYRAVCWAYARSIVNGTSSTRFSPSAPITREQLVTIFFRYADYKNLSTSARADLSGYADRSAVSGYATEAFQWAVAVGLITGVSENQLAPQASATRAQCATLLQRFTQWVSHAGGSINYPQIAGGNFADTMTWALYKDGTLKISGTGAIADYAKGDKSQPWANYQKSITALVVENGITRIGDRAFQSCSKLERAVIGKDVASIGEWAFQNCYALTSVELQPSIQLETGAFRSTPVEWEISAIGSETYAKSKYYAALNQVPLTGHYREDIINIALSQVGYHEGNSEADYTGANVNGSKDYTEYGRRLDSVGTAWCSEFASWCIRMAGVPTQIVVSSRAANVSSFTKNTSAAWYTWKDTVYGSGSYTLRKGDLLLWSWENGSYGTDENLSHTSIFWGIYKHENGTVTLKTIDGNSSNQVQICSYQVNEKDGRLVGRDGQLCYIIAPDYESGEK